MAGSAEGGLKRCHSEMSHDTNNDVDDRKLSLKRPRSERTQSERPWSKCKDSDVDDRVWYHPPGYVMMYNVAGKARTTDLKDFFTGLTIAEGGIIFKTESLQSDSITVYVKFSTIEDALKTDSLGDSLLCGREVYIEMISPFVFEDKRSGYTEHDYQPTLVPGLEPNKACGNREPVCFLYQEAFPSDATACEIWGWFGGANGPSSGVILVRSKDGSADCAYIGFEEHLSNTADTEDILTANKTYQALSELSPTIEIVESTEMGKDRKFSDESRALLAEMFAFQRGRESKKIRVLLMGDSRVNGLESKIRAGLQATHKNCIDFECVCLPQEDIENWADISNTVHRGLLEMKYPNYDIIYLMAGISELITPIESEIKIKPRFHSSEEIIEHFMTKYCETHDQLQEYAEKVVICELVGLSFGLYNNADHHGCGFFLDEQDALNEAIREINYRISVLNEEHALVSPCMSDHIHKTRHGQLSHHYHGTLINGFYFNDFFQYKIATNFVVTLDQNNVHKSSEEWKGEPEVEVSTCQREIKRGLQAEKDGQEKQTDKSKQTLKDTDWKKHDNGKNENKKRRESYQEKSEQKMLPSHDLVKKLCGLGAGQNISKFSIRVLLIGDSRMNGLEHRIRKDIQASDMDHIYFECVCWPERDIENEANIDNTVHRGMVEKIYPYYDIIYLMAGVSELFTSDANCQDHKIKPAFSSTEEMIVHLMSKIRGAQKYLQHYAEKVVICELVGLDFRLSGEGYYPDEQVSLNDAIMEINRQVSELNRDFDIVAPCVAEHTYRFQQEGFVHRYEETLCDGFYYNEEFKDEISRHFILTFQQNCIKLRRKFLEKSYSIQKSLEDMLRSLVKQLKLADVDKGQEEQMKISGEQAEKEILLTQEEANEIEEIIEKSGENSKEGCTDEVEYKKSCNLKEEQLVHMVTSQIKGELNTKERLRCAKSATISATDEEKFSKEKSGERTEASLEISDDKVSSINLGADKSAEEIMDKCGENSEEVYTAEADYNKSSHLKGEQLVQMFTSQIKGEHSTKEMLRCAKGVTTSATDEEKFSKEIRGEGIETSLETSDDIMSSINLEADKSVEAIKESVKEITTAQIASAVTQKGNEQNNSSIKLKYKSEDSQTISMTNGLKLCEAVESEKNSEEDMLSDVNLDTGHITSMGKMRGLLIGDSRLNGLQKRIDAVLLVNNINNVDFECVCPPEGDLDDEADIENIIHRGLVEMKHPKYDIIYVMAGISELFMTDENSPEHSQVKPKFSSSEDIVEHLMAKYSEARNHLQRYAEKVVICELIGFSFGLYNSIDGGGNYPDEQEALNTSIVEVNRRIQEMNEDLIFPWGSSCIHKKVGNMWYHRYIGQMLRGFYLKDMFKEQMATNLIVTLTKNFVSVNTREQSLEVRPTAPIEQGGVSEVDNKHYGKMDEFGGESNATSTLNADSNELHKENDTLERIMEAPRKTSDDKVPVPEIEVLKYGHLMTEPIQLIVTTLIEQGTLDEKEMGQRKPGDGLTTFLSDEEEKFHEKKLEEKQKERMENSRDKASETASLDSYLDNGEIMSVAKIRALIIGDSRLNGLQLRIDAVLQVNNMSNIDVECVCPPEGNLDNEADIDNIIHRGLVEMKHRKYNIIYLMAGVSELFITDENSPEHSQIKPMFTSSEDIVEHLMTKYHEALSHIQWYAEKVVICELIGLSFEDYNSRAGDGAGSYPGEQEALNAAILEINKRIQELNETVSGTKWHHHYGGQMLKGFYFNDMLKDQIAKNLVVTLVQNFVKEKTKESIEGLPTTKIELGGRIDVERLQDEKTNMPEEEFEDVAAVYQTDRDKFLQGNYENIDRATWFGNKYGEVSVTKIEDEKTNELLKDSVDKISTSLRELVSACMTDQDQDKLIAKVGCNSEETPLTYKANGNKLIKDKVKQQERTATLQENYNKVSIIIEIGEDNSIPKKEGVSMAGIENGGDNKLKEEVHDIPTTRLELPVGRPSERDVGQNKLIEQFERKFEDTSTTFRTIRTKPLEKSDEQDERMEESHEKSDKVSPHEIEAEQNRKLKGEDSIHRMSTVGIDLEIPAIPLWGTFSTPACSVQGYHPKSDMKELPYLQNKRNKAYEATANVNTNLDENEPEKFRVLLMGDSRINGLEARINAGLKASGMHNIDFECVCWPEGDIDNGADIDNTILRGLVEKKHSTYDLIYFMAGINELFIPDESSQRHIRVKPRFYASKEIIEHLLTKYRHARDLLQAYTRKVVICELFGFSFGLYNTESLDKNLTNSYLYEQNSLDVSLVDIYSGIMELNKETGMVCPWIVDHAHKRTDEELHNRYKCTLTDGFYFNEMFKDEIVNNFIISLCQNVQHISQETTEALSAEVISTHQVEPGDATENHVSLGYKMELNESKESIITCKMDGKKIEEQTEGMEIFRGNPEQKISCIKAISEESSINQDTKQAILPPKFHVLLIGDARVDGIQRQIHVGLQESRMDDIDFECVCWPEGQMVGDDIDTTIHQGLLGKKCSNYDIIYLMAGINDLFTCQQIDPKTIYAIPKFRFSEEITKHLITKYRAARNKLQGFAKKVVICELVGFSFGLYNSGEIDGIASYRDEQNSLDTAMMELKRMITLLNQEQNITAPYVMDHTHKKRGKRLSHRYEATLIQGLYFNDFFKEKIAKNLIGTLYQNCQKEMCLEENVEETWSGQIELGSHSLEQAQEIEAKSKDPTLTCMREEKIATDNEEQDSKELQPILEKIATTSIPWWQRLEAEEKSLGVPLPEVEENKSNKQDIEEMHTGKVKILLLGDSRVNGLQTRIEFGLQDADLNDIDFECVCWPEGDVDNGADIDNIVHGGLVDRKHSTYDIVYLMAGINELFTGDAATKKLNQVKPKFVSSKEIVEHLVTKYRKARMMLKCCTKKVVICELVGFSFGLCNTGTPRGPCSYQDEQLALNEAVVELNTRIREINEDHEVVAPWVVDHTYKSRRKELGHHYAETLYEGFYYNDMFKDKIARNLIISLPQNLVKLQGSSEDKHGREPVVKISTAQIEPGRHEVDKEHEQLMPNIKLCKDSNTPSQTFRVKYEEGVPPAQEEEETSDLDTQQNIPMKKISALLIGDSRLNGIQSKLDARLHESGMSNVEFECVCCEGDIHDEVDIGYTILGGLVEKCHSNYDIIYLMAGISELFTSKQNNPTIYHLVPNFDSPEKIIDHMLTKYREVHDQLQAYSEKVVICELVGFSFGLFNSGAVNGVGSYPNEQFALSRAMMVLNGKISVLNKENGIACPRVADTTHGIRDGKMSHCYLETLVKGFYYNDAFKDKITNKLLDTVFQNLPPKAPQESIKVKSEEKASTSTLQREFIKGQEETQGKSGGICHDKAMLAEADVPKTCATETKPCMSAERFKVLLIGDSRVNGLEQRITAGLKEDVYFECVCWPPGEIQNEGCIADTVHKALVEKKLPTYDIIYLMTGIGEVFTGKAENKAINIGVKPKFVCPDAITDHVISKYKEARDKLQTYGGKVVISELIGMSFAHYNSGSVHGADSYHSEQIVLNDAIMNINSRLKALNVNVYFPRISSPSTKIRQGRLSNRYPAVLCEGYYYNDGYKDQIAQYVITTLHQNRERIHRSRVK